MKRYQKIAVGLFLLVTLVASQMAPKTPTIFMIGDSTMADKKDPDNNPERGWGQMLPLFFNEQIQIDNHAVNGRSTKSFVDEGRWEKVKKAIKPGDYVVIQFGHNDQKEKDPSRYTNPYSGYRRNLTRFVQEAREKGATPILASSTVRRHFNEHGTLVDTHGAYPHVARQVALEFDVPFIDMQMQTEDLVNRLGVEDSKDIYLWLEPGENDMYPEGNEDNTHFNVYGAKKVAKMAVKALRSHDLPLNKYMVLLESDKK